MHGTLQLLVLDLPVVEEAQLTSWVTRRVTGSLQAPRGQRSVRLDQIERLRWDGSSLEEHVRVLLDRGLG